MVLHWTGGLSLGIRLALVLICGEFNITSSYLFWDCMLAFHVLLDSIMRIPFYFITLYKPRKVPIPGTLSNRNPPSRPRLQRRNIQLPSIFFHRR